MNTREEGKTVRGTKNGLSKTMISTSQEWIAQNQMQRHQAH